MTYKYFSHNGSVLPIEEAVVPLSSVEYSYGFGVYETIRVSKGTVYFADEHCARLMESARIIGLDHAFSTDFVKTGLQELLSRNEAETCNLKVLLIGGAQADTATLDILCLNPLFPDRKLYTEGTACTTYNYERAFPGAKTLNMLQSYLAYREAKAAGAYDALLVNRDGCITEGTRTNFFVIKDRTVVSPPLKEILPGVTRTHMLEVAAEQGFEIVEKDTKLADLPDYDGAFLTSTPVKIVPIKSIGKHEFSPIPPALRELMSAFDKFLSEYANRNQ
jgi:branched-chain amino acid aminotransferase